MVRIDESQLSAFTPEQARQRAVELTGELKYAGADVPQRLLDELAKNQTDPYFASEFTRQRRAPAPRIAYGDGP